MKNQTNKYNLLDLLRNKYVVVNKMIPLSDKIGSTLRLPLAYNNMLAHGRLGRLAGGIWRTQKFIAYVLTLWRAHGVAFTVKWLKGAHVAIAKALGRDKLLSLRQLTEDLPLPRLSNGMPRFIPAPDRARMRSGHVPTIRFWLGLFNLYRVLEAPAKLNLGTITDPWTGDGKGMLKLLRAAKELKFFSQFKEGSLTDVSRLAPSSFVLSRSASPSNSVSMYGVLTDAFLLKEEAPNLWSTIKNYLRKTKAAEFDFMLEEAYSLAARLEEWKGFKDPSVSTGYHLSKSGKPIMQPDPLRFKSSIRDHGLGAGGGLSQFAIKEEPGKIRVFALVDNITQSTLRPLHDYLFSILKVLPTDGTFNQDASVERLMIKASRSGKAFSFDLTAATDRVPVLLSQYVLGVILGDMELARLWRKLMVRRDFGFNPVVAKKLQLDPDTEYRYRVGQPMGALSSWAMLAITHHWIVQYAAYLTYSNQDWFEEYEVLGDDIVITDAKVAAAYLEIMSTLGCGINMTKSISSPTLPVFEFAKRVCWGAAIVSGISLAQVRAGWRVAGRVANAIQFAKAGLLEPSSSLLLACLSRNAFSGGKVLPRFKTNSPRSQKTYALGVLSLLGERFQNGIIPLRVLMHAIIDPFGPIDLKRDQLVIPIRAASELAYSALVRPNATHPYPFSHEWKREPKYLELEDKVAIEILHQAVNKCKLLWDHFDSLITIGAQQLYFGLYYVNRSDGERIPFKDLPQQYAALVLEIEQFYSWMLGFEMSRLHPQFLYQELYMEMDSTLLYEEALDYYQRVESLEQRLQIVDPLANRKPQKTIIETAPILATLRGILGPGKVRRWLEAFSAAEIGTFQSNFPES